MKIRSIVLLLLVILLGLSGCTSERAVVAKPADSVQGVTLIQVREQAVPDLFAAVGTTRAARTAPLSAEVTGRVTAIYVHEGDAVTQGQTLLTIEEAQPKAALNQAQSAFNAADHEAAAAESERALAETTFARMKTLHEAKSISPQEFDEAGARVQSATAHRDAMIAARAQAAAALQQAHIVLDHTRVRAPFDGVITGRRVDPGMLASPGLELLTVEATGHYRLEVSVNEQDLKYVRLGEAVPVALDAVSGAPLTGKVAQIVPAGDSASRSFVIKVDLPATAGMRSGLFGHADFLHGQKQAILIPHTAILQQGQIQSVYAIDLNNVAAVRFVTVGRTRAADVEVLSGLSPGDRLVADPGGQDLAGKRIGEH